ncbi:MAG: transcription antitermination factor NusB [Proteobacteria bacterium]|nr:transcription antitermination factor NusB [Pseudomonadota bacterium]
MMSRRLAREQALQVLYQLDLHTGDVEQALALWWQAEPADPDVVEFAGAVVRGVREHLDRIDTLLGAASTNWKVSRMSYVDRNILRLGTFEILEMEDVPTMVSINEAIELGKRFGTTESGSFINGVLDRVAKNLDRV